jgi:hypothetical protein
VFFITAGVYAFGTVFYGLFGSGDRQPWSETKIQEEGIPMKVVSVEAGETKEEAKEQS